MTTDYTPKALPTPFTDLLTDLENEVEEWDNGTVDTDTLMELVTRARDNMRWLLQSDTADHGPNNDTPNPTRDAWVSWLLNYGPGKFYDAFMQTAQDAESECRNCGDRIYLDIAEGGGVPDWRTEDGDYGCCDSPDNTDESTGGHVPARLDKAQV